MRECCVFSHLESFLLSKHRGCRLKSSGLISFSGNETRQLDWDLKALNYEKPVLGGTLRQLEM